MRRTERCLSTWDASPCNEPRLSLYTQHRRIESIDHEMLHKFTPRATHDMPSTPQFPKGVEGSAGLCMLCNIRDTQHVA